MPCPGRHSNVGAASLAGNPDILVPETVKIEDGLRARRVEEERDADRAGGTPRGGPEETEGTLSTREALNPSAQDRIATKEEAEERELRHVPGGTKLNQDSNTAPVTFHDVAAYFSDEEWMLLYNWQNELYANVMKEINQALTSLGPVIAASVFSLRAKDKKCLYSVDDSDSERRGDVRHSPTQETTVAVTSAIIKEEDEVYSMEYQHSRQTQNISCLTAFPVNTSVLSERFKKEKEAHCQAVQDVVGENTGERYVKSDISFGVKIDESQPRKDHQDANKIDSSNCLTAVHEMNIPITLASFKEEGELYAAGCLEPTKQQNINFPAAHQSEAASLDVFQCMKNITHKYSLKQASDRHFSCSDCEKSSF
ncbi:hypothetical protein NDU88_005096 [Pleurodeles waltl]|uniref:KRAB domain-containing protein n=1 Tax=Pleurodeles waltl TaxID=8319 RepID=A0AAV7MWU1_PLEWA|nr:hypothetical protein NDU88_005096 [Pleurodeles waltl]